MSVLNELKGRGWTDVQPPALNDDQSVIARFDGEPIKAGFRVETLEDNGSVLHEKFRTGCYDLEVKLFQGANKISGQVKVEEADGY